MIPGNPILDALLPSLLYMNLVSLLDGAFDLYMDVKGLSMPKTYRSDLNVKITFLTDQSTLKNGAALHALRRKRNETAREIKHVDRRCFHDVRFSVPVASIRFDGLLRRVLHAQRLWGGELFQGKGNVGVIPR